MNTVRKVSNLTATLITIGSLVGGAMFSSCAAQTAAPGKKSHKVSETINEWAIALVYKHPKENYYCAVGPEDDNFIDIVTHGKTTINTESFSNKRPKTITGFEQLVYDESNTWYETPMGALCKLVGFHETIQYERIVHGKFKPYEGLIPPEPYKNGVYVLGDIEINIKNSGKFKFKAFLISRPVLKVGKTAFADDEFAPGDPRYGANNFKADIPELRKFSSIANPKWLILKEQ